MSTKMAKMYCWFLLHTMWTAMSANGSSLDQFGPVTYHEYAKFKDLDVYFKSLRT
jgi:hypothetical protein